MADLAIAGSLVIGGQLGNYLIESLIGRGGMGVVYRATHVRLGTPVAIKVLAEELSSDDAFRERFLREAKMAATIDHPNVIPVYDTGLFEESLYIVMRYVAGADLRALLKSSGSLSPEATVELLRPAARALDAAHRHGLIHRDVKPANILLQQSPTGATEHVYLSDFGVSKHSGSESGLTSKGTLVGTVAYMSPEQIQGQGVTPATDIYALACMFYQCVTGTPPFERDSPAAVLWAHVNAEVEPLSRARPGVPPALDEAIAQGMAKDPADRFTSCEDLIAACAAALVVGAGAPSAAAAAGVPDPPAEVPPAPAPAPPEPAAEEPAPPPAEDEEVPDEPGGLDLEEDVWVTFGSTPAVTPPGAEAETPAPPPPPEPPVEPPPAASEPPAPPPAFEPEPAAAAPPPPEPPPPPPPEPEPPAAPPPPEPEPEPEPVADAPPPPQEPPPPPVEPAPAPPTPEPVVAAAASAPSSPAGGGSRERSWLAERWWVAVLAVLLVGGGVAAAVGLSGGGSSSKSSSSASSTTGSKPKSGTSGAQPGFPAKLEPIPTNRVHGQGNAVLRVKGNTAAVTVTTGGLLGGAPHALHIHAGGKGVCPPASAARRHGGHRTISTLDGGPFYGAPVAALTTRGDTSPKSILAFARFERGNLDYSRTITLPAQVVAYIAKSNAVIIVHGIDFNHNGLYDGVLDRSDLDRKYPGEATAPALCGTIVPKSGGSADAGGGHTYVASLHYSSPADSPWICSVPARDSRGDGVQLAANPARPATAVTGT